MIDQLKIEPMASSRQHDLARDSGVFECEDNAAGRENLRKEHVRHLG